MKLPRVVLVTDPAFSDDVIVRCTRDVGRVLPRGSFGVQLRDKRRPVISLRVFAWRLREVTGKVGAVLIVNGNAHVARDVGADGVHLGGGAGSVERARAVLSRRGWVSVAAHTDGEVQRARDEGADAVVVSPIFSTRSASSRSIPQKVGRGVAAIRSARALAPAGLFVYALGGISSATAGACAAAGADGVALIRALLASGEPSRVARSIDDALARRW
jgi:thiamine-phosphate pyrophosphorylase